VIAIIAILAAILFPVFARAKESAKRTACLSNVRQQSMALQMYLSDEDDRMPTAYQSYTDFQYHDVWNLVMPYAKNLDLFYCPDRTQKGCTGDPSSPDDTRCIGYGFNWGPIQNFTDKSFEGGLMNAYQVADDWQGAVGQNESSVVSPADTFAFGDSHDRTWYTISMNTILSKFEGSTNHELVHGDQFNMNYVDGHAKNLRWHIGMVRPFHIGPGVKYLFPRNNNDFSRWCADPDASVNVPSGLVGGSTMPCKDVGNYYFAKVTTWASD